MFKQLKSQAKMTVLKNYKYIFVPILLYELFSSLVINFFDFALLNKLGFLMLMSMVLIIKFIVLPIFIIMFFRIGICITNDKNKFSIETTKILTHKEIIKILTINFVPNIIDFIYSLVKYFKTDYDNLLIYYFFIFILIIAKYYSEYKFFVCNYYCALENFSAKEILVSSFKIMKNKFLDFIIFNLSFILWDLLIAIIWLLGIYVLNLIDVEVIYFRFMISSVFGLMFFYRPYRFMSNLLFAKYLNGNRRGR